MKTRGFLVLIILFVALIFFSCAPKPKNYLIKLNETEYFLFFYSLENGLTAYFMSQEFGFSESRISSVKIKYDETTVVPYVTRGLIFKDVIYGIYFKDEQQFQKYFDMSKAKTHERIEK